MTNNQKRLAKILAAEQIFSPSDGELTENIGEPKEEDTLYFLEGFPVSIFNIDGERLVAVAHIARVIEGVAGHHAAEGILRFNKGRVDLFWVPVDVKRKSAAVKIANVIPLVTRCVAGLKGLVIRNPNSKCAKTRRTKLERAERFIEEFREKMEIYQPERVFEKEKEKVPFEELESFKKGKRGEEVLKKILLKWGAYYRDENGVERKAPVEVEEMPAGSLVDLKCTNTITGELVEFAECKVRSSAFQYRNGRFECYTFPKSQIDQYASYKGGSVWLYILNPTTKEFLWRDVLMLLEEYAYEDAVFPATIEGQNGSEFYVFYKEQFVIDDLSKEDADYINGVETVEEEKTVEEKVFTDAEIDEAVKKVNQAHKLIKELPDVLAKFDTEDGVFEKLQDKIKADVTAAFRDAVGELYARRYTY